MESTFRYTWTRFLLVLAVLALLTGTVWAQGSGEIAGLVTDPTGAVISGATVTLMNSATGEKRTTVTSSTGNYRFPALPVVGTYAVQVSPKGFKSTKIEGIVVSVGVTATADLKLELGAASEQVTVEASAETVQTTDSAVSQLVDRNIWQNMPLEVRNQNSFIELVAGAVPQNNTGNNRGAAVNGTREGAGSYLMEGADNNEQGQAGRGQISNYDQGGAATSISPDAIQEYRVITNSYSAEYGKGGGFITDTVLKGGTNQWHGSAFEYNRIQALTANDWESNASQTKDHLVRNQFGGSIGGPIIKDKTFFYGTAEIHRVRQSVPLTTKGTTQQFLDFVNNGGLAAWAESNAPVYQNNSNPGLCWSYTGAACPGLFTSAGVPGATSLGPVFNALRAVSPYPVATNASTFSSAGAGFWTAGLNYFDSTGAPVPVYGQVTVADPEAENEERFSVKVDHRFSDKDSVNAVLAFQQALYTDTYGGGYNALGPAYTQDGRGQTWVASWNHTFTPTILNTFKAGFLRHRVNFPADPKALGTPAYYTIDGMGVDLGYYSGLPQFFTDNQFQYLDSLSFVKGKHNFKVGGEYRRTRNGSTFFNDKYSSVLPWGVEDTVTDLAFSDIFNHYLGGTQYGGAYLMSASINPTTGQSPDYYRGYRANEVAFYVQDDWRVSSRLTMNLGLRWEYFGPPHNFQPNIDSNLYFGSTATPVPTFVGSSSCGGTNQPRCSTNPFFPTTSPFYASVSTAVFQMRNASIWNKDTNNFGPRVGFAYDVTGHQKLIMRAGFGIMYDRIYNNVFENIRFNPPLFSDNQIGPTFNGVPAGPISSPGLLTYPFTSLSLYNNPIYSPKPNPRHMDQNMATPYYEQAHLGFQWEFLKGYVFQPEYVGTFGHKLIGLSDINTFDGRTSATPAVSGAAAVCKSTAVPNGLACSKSQRINDKIGADNYRSNGYSSNYHALQMTVRKTYSNGLGLNVNYTYSKALDTMSDLFNNRAGAHPTDNMNIHYDYGPADFNSTQRVVGTVSYDLPFMKGNRWIGGWGVNTIVSWQTGHPASPHSGASSYDLNKDGYYTDRLVPVGTPSSTILSSSPGNGYFNADKWVLYDPQGLNNGHGSCPLTVNGGYWCDVPIGRNSLIGPALTNVDFDISKKFKINERAGVTFQANFFDLFNHPNWSNPDVNIQDYGSTFGKSLSTLGDSGGHRVVQLALRLDF
ncbi:MAG: TonB-dependent receptor [Terriglobales bacterium]